MAVICSPQHVAKLTAALPEAKVIGKLIKTPKSQKIIIT